jgi:hypothetical protein
MQSPRAARLKALRDIASLVHAGSDLPTILECIVAAICQHTPWSMSGIMKVDLESGFSELLARHIRSRCRPNELPTCWSLTTSSGLCPRSSLLMSNMLRLRSLPVKPLPGYRARWLFGSYDEGAL